MADRQQQIGLDEAIEVFVRGWSLTRSRTHPYLPERVGPVWVLRDAPRTGRSPKYRREEWVAPAALADELQELARQQTRGSYAICAVVSSDESDEPVRQAYRKLGYRLGGSEPMMVQPLNRIPRAETSVTVTRVRTPELLERVAEARNIRPQAGLLEPDSPVRQYVALDGAVPAGWVESIAVSDDAGVARAWCENMFVDPAHRRRGIAKALLSHMLRDDRRRGARCSVLLASHAGAKLYPLMNYRQLGTLLIFTPPKVG